MHSKKIHRLHRLEAEKQKAESRKQKAQSTKHKAQSTKHKAQSTKQSQLASAFNEYNNCNLWMVTRNHESHLE